jgi:hypothetical protein
MLEIKDIDLILNFHNWKISLYILFKECKKSYLEKIK